MDCEFDSRGMTKQDSAGCYRLLYRLNVPFGHTFSTRYYDLASHSAYCRPLRHPECRGTRVSPRARMEMKHGKIVLRRSFVVVKYSDSLKPMSIYHVLAGVLRYHSSSPYAYLVATARAILRMESSLSSSSISSSPAASNPMCQSQPTLQRLLRVPNILR